MENANVFFSHVPSCEVYQLPGYCSRGQHLVFDIYGCPMGGRWECSQAHFQVFFDVRFSMFQAA